MRTYKIRQMGMITIEVSYVIKEQICHMVIKVRWLCVIGMKFWFIFSVDIYVIKFFSHFCDFRAETWQTAWTPVNVLFQIGRFYDAEGNINDFIVPFDFDS